MATLPLSKAVVPAKYGHLLFQRRFEGIVSLLEEGMEESGTGRSNSRFPPTCTSSNAASRFSSSKRT